MGSVHNTTNSDSRKWRHIFGINRTWFKTRLEETKIAEIFNFGMEDYMETRNKETDSS